jgi:hypothetical protein
MQRNGIYHQSDEWQRKYCAGTTYNWAEPVSNPAGAIAGGSLCYDQPNIISQNLTNTTNSSATLTYTVPKSGASAIVSELHSR